MKNYELKSAAVVVVIVVVVVIAQTVLSSSVRLRRLYQPYHFLQRYMQYMLEFAVSEQFDYGTAPENCRWRSDKRGVIRAEGERTCEVESSWHQQFVSGKCNGKACGFQNKTGRSIPDIGCYGSHSQLKRSSPVFMNTFTFILNVRQALQIKGAL